MHDQHCRRFDTALNRRDFLARAGAGMGLLALGAMAHAEEAAASAWPMCPATSCGKS